MALKPENIHLKKRNPRGIPDDYTYFHPTDTIADITASGYFSGYSFTNDNPRFTGFDLPDTEAVAIQVQCADGPYEVQLVGGVASVVSGYAPRNRTILLSSYGVRDGDDLTSAIQSIESAIQDGDYVVFDVTGTYTSTNGIKVTASNVTYEFRKFITVDGLDHTIKPYFLQISGFKKNDLTITSGDISDGDTSFDVADVTDIESGDLIYIMSNEYFNGTGASGDPVCYKSVVAKVRSVSGSTINVFGQIPLSIQSANITNVESWRGGNNCTVKDVKLIGPGIQATIDNGAGAQGIDFNYTTDCYAYDSNISGFQNRQLSFTNCYNSWCVGGEFSSGLTDYCSTNFYGVVHQGGQNGFVVNATGRNLRRVADTGTSHAAINVSHVNITGIDCNGSAAGTHHALNYSFSNIRSLGVSGSGFTFRAKNITGVELLGNAVTSGSGVVFGSAEDANSSCGHVDISKINVSTIGGSSAVKVFANGDYDLSGRFFNGSLSVIVAQSEKIEGFRVRGVITKESKGILFNSSTPTQLDNVDICDVRFVGGSDSDITVNAPSDPDNRAENLKICENKSTSVSQAIVTFNSGYIEGLTAKLVNNRNTNNSSSAVDLIDNAGARFTAPPEMYGNMVVNAGERTGRTEEIQRIIGEYTAIGDVPSGTTAIKGCVVIIAKPSTGDNYKYFCTTDGTVGTISGVTGSITSGSNQLALSGNGGKLVDVGHVIRVTGAGSASGNLDARVTNMTSDGATATLAVNASTTVSGAAVNYKVPTFTGTGTL